MGAYRRGLVPYRHRLGEPAARAVEPHTHGGGRAADDAGGLTGESPCHAARISTSRSSSPRDTRAFRSAIRSATSSAMSPSTVSVQSRSSAASEARLTSARPVSRRMLRATPSSQGSGGWGTSPIRRQATVKVSLTTSSATCRPARLTAYAQTRCRQVSYIAVKRAASSDTPCTSVLQGHLLPGSGVRGPIVTA